MGKIQKGFKAVSSIVLLLAFFTYGCARGLVDHGNIILPDGRKVGAFSVRDETAGGPAIKIVRFYQCDWARVPLPSGVSPTATVPIAYYGENDEVKYIYTTYADAPAAIRNLSQKLGGKLVKGGNVQVTLFGQGEDGKYMPIHYQSPEDERCSVDDNGYGAHSESLLATIIKFPVAVATGGFFYYLGQKHTRPDEHRTNIVQDGGRVSGGNVHAAGGDAKSQGGQGGKGGQSTSLAVQSQDQNAEGGEGGAGGRGGQGGQGGVGGRASVGNVSARGGSASANPTVQNTVRNSASSSSDASSGSSSSVSTGNISSRNENISQDNHNKQINY